MKDKQSFINLIIRVRDELNKDKDSYKMLDDLISRVDGIYEEKISLEQKLAAAQDLLDNKLYNEIYKEVLRDNINSILRAFNKSAIKTTIISIVVTTVLSFCISLYLGKMQMDEMVAESGSQVGSVGTKILQYIKASNISSSDQRSVYKEAISFFSKHKIHKLDKNYISLLYKGQVLPFDPMIEHETFLAAINRLINDNNINIRITKNDLVKWENDYTILLKNIVEFVSDRIKNEDSHKFQTSEMTYDNFKSENDATDYHKYILPFFEVQSAYLGDFTNDMNRIIVSLEIKNNLYKFEK